MTSLPEDLQETLELFQCGSYAEALSLASAAEPCPEREALIARCYLACQLLDNIKGMQRSEIPALKAVALMAVFLKAPSNRVQALERLRELFQATNDSSVCYLLSCAEALSGVSVCSSVSEETAALEVMGLVRRNQLRNARLLLERGMSRGWDSPATKIAQTWLLIAEGQGEEAAGIFDELTRQFRCGGTALLTLGRRGADLASQDREIESIQGPLSHEWVEEQLVVQASAAFRKNKMDEGFSYIQQLAEINAENELVRGVRNCQAAFASFA